MDFRAFPCVLASDHHAPAPSPNEHGHQPGDQGHPTPARQERFEQWPLPDGKVHSRILSPLILLAANPVR